MTWFKKPKQKLVSQKRELAADVWVKCDGCGEILYERRLSENAHVCPDCGHHFRIPADEYIALLLDDGFLEEFDTNLRSADPLGFVDSKPYTERVEAAIEKVGPADAIRTGRGRLDDREVYLGAMDFGFIGGSMGSVVGEKIRRLARSARGFVVPEINLGQMSLEVERCASGLARTIQVPHAGGWVHDPEDIYAALVEVTS